jgi:hypothetical protein
MAVKCPNKSSARGKETHLIKLLKMEGYDIEQDSDINHRLFHVNN